MMNFWPYRKTRSATGASTTSTIEDRYGIKTWSEPQDAILDIVFIHGLSGHRERTWTIKDGLGFWPKVFLAPKLPDARILTYGYDASIVRADSPISGNRIGDHAKNLLSALATYRESDNSINRPIIFVAHSLGGLVCEDTLIASRASAEEHLQRIVRCTRGIAFLGTPHSGTDLATSMDRIVKWIAYTREVNTRIAKILTRDSEVLSRIQADFHSMLKSRINEGLPDISITCFYEELPIPRFGEVVPKSSAILPSYPAIGIHSNHREMTKFASDNDPRFLSLYNELNRWVNDIRFETAEANGVADAGPPQPTVVLSSGSQQGGITIWGNVVQSSIVNGSQTINGDLSFG